MLSTTKLLAKGIKTFETSFNQTIASRVQLKIGAWKDLDFKVRMVTKAINFFDKDCETSTINAPAQRLFNTDCKILLLRFTGQVNFDRQNGVQYYLGTFLADN